MTGHAHPLAVAIENRDAAGRCVIVCEHASNAFPEPWGALGLSDAQRAAHIAWDPGALGLARGLAERLGSVLIHAGASRLIYDLNRPPQSRGAMAERSEIHDIPGNRALAPETRLMRTEALYVPFHATVRAEIARRLALGLDPVLVTVHSFTPVYAGKPRAVELGVIHDADPTLARAVLAEAEARTPLVTRLNEPYSAADEVTHTLALHATPMGIANVMLELRNDLIATPEAQVEMADRLAPVLEGALARAANVEGAA
ncbi:N-formylglutamate amidohydrolase [Pseudothioclava nitratireducens]|uniref:N-formylglutamate amidohydrolase n=1 Tax=Pseudothioclava nitratireducens TaxID=1928646 RepID=UPI0023DB57E0|nr:N-formylglutamate amidohydrolase [Defluviimonas nitratireducens]MDF1621170.1 N-formylglutamate amidohydrolase [Defluviimonas nitratireducens]